jgi:uncharacterized membrane protein HdeD (DUF308 family)
MKQQSTKWLTPLQIRFFTYVLGIVFGVVALVEPSFAYQIIGIVIGIYGLVYGGLLAYRLLARIKDNNQTPHLSILMFIAIIAVGILFILIPLALLKQTVSIVLMVCLIGFAAYQLYFIRQNPINHLAWKNYLLGGIAIVLAVLVFIYMNETGNIVMMLLGLTLLIYSTYQLLLLILKKS